MTFYSHEDCALCWHQVKHTQAEHTQAIRDYRSEREREIRRRAIASYRAHYTTEPRP